MGIFSCNWRARVSARGGVKGQDEAVERAKAGQECGNGLSCGSAHFGLRRTQEPALSSSTHRGPHYAPLLRVVGWNARSSGIGLSD